MRRHLSFLLLIPLLVGCTSISANPLQNLQNTQIGATVVTGIQNATWNIDQAVAVGALDPSDPAQACLHKIQTQFGIDPNAPAAPSFVPRRTDLISEGSIVYIEIQILKKLQAGGLANTVPPECKAIVGQIVLDAMSANIKAMPGGGLLPILK
jgi:hypothetical protein